MYTTPCQSFVAELIWILDHLVGVRRTGELIRGGNNKHDVSHVVNKAAPEARPCGHQVPVESGSFPQAVPQDQVRRKKRARPWSPAFLSQTGGSLHTCSFFIHPGHHKNFYIMVENRLGSVSASGTKNVLLIHLNPRIFLNSYSSHKNTVTGKSVTILPDKKPCKVPREHSTEALWSHVCTHGRAKLEMLSGPSHGYHICRTLRHVSTDRYLESSSSS